MNIYEISNGSLFEFLEVHHSVFSNVYYTPEKINTFVIKRLLAYSFI